MTANCAVGRGVRERDKEDRIEVNVQRTIVSVITDWFASTVRDREKERQNMSW